MEPVHLVHFLPKSQLIAEHASIIAQLEHLGMHGTMLASGALMVTSLQLKTPPSASHVATEHFPTLSKLVKIAP